MREWPRESIGRRLLRAVLGAYMRVYHRLELRGAERLPPRGPLLVVLNHASLLDVPALMVLDPYPNTATIVKASLFRVPMLSWVLAQWGAIAVEREGRDSTGVRRLLGALKDGQVLAVAAEGRRSRTGRLESINPVLARIAIVAGVTIVPLGIAGSQRALPPGAHVPRPARIVVRVGTPFRLERGTPAEAAAAHIQAAIAALLPPEQQPLPVDLAPATDTAVLPAVP